MVALSSTQHRKLKIYINTNTVSYAGEVTPFKRSHQSLFGFKDIDWLYLHSFFRDKCSWERNTDIYRLFQIAGYWSRGCKWKCKCCCETATVLEHIKVSFPVRGHQLLSCYSVWHLKCSGTSDTAGFEVLFMFPLGWTQEATEFSSSPFRHHKVTVSVLCASALRRLGPDRWCHTAGGEGGSLGKPSGQTLVLSQVRFDPFQTVLHNVSVCWDFPESLRQSPAKKKKKIHQCHLKTAHGILQ